MGFTKEQLLARLQELQIGFSQYEHPVALTVEDQAKYVGHLKGGLSKNLFLKDKKQRLYIVSALAETKVDLKVLSIRLGLGKGGLRMAPEEALAEILQVPLGCVTPFALVNESARHVSLLLDQGFKNHEFCFFHPLSNDMSIALNALDLDKFLISIEKTPAYVDLEANPKVGKDQPPDLAAFVPSDAKLFADPVAKSGATQGPEKDHVFVNNNKVLTDLVSQPKATQGLEKDHVSVNNNKSTTGTDAKDVKPSNPSKKPKEKTSDAVNSSITYANTNKFVEEVLEKMKSIILSEGQPATTVSKDVDKLGNELKIIANMFKNKAYTEGFNAGIHHQPKRM